MITLGLMKYFFGYAQFVILILLLFAQASMTQVTVTIGNQVWMTKNLNVDKFRNGDLIPHAASNEEWMEARNRQQPAWCSFDNDIQNDFKYGKLYNWYAITDQRGIAPEGYHIPSDSEWTVLSNTLGLDAGFKMKSTSGWKPSSFERISTKTETAVSNGSNSSGFSALPGGRRSGIVPMFFYLGSIGFWWSSTEEFGKFVYVRSLNGNENGIIQEREFEYSNGLSVRCIKN
jgi:uncharacterized protein (TIGR02145 family)